MGMKLLSELSVFRAFRSRNYLLYFLGRSITQFGTWMQRFAVVWVIYSLTHSTFMSGVTFFAEQFPAFLFSFAGGVVADRYNRITVIRITQFASMIQAVILAVLVYTGHALAWEILTLSVILGIINAFDIPARQSLIHLVVTDESDLPNAISLTTATASLAQILGAGSAGLLLAALGAPACFLINAASFGGVIISLLLMKLPPYQQKKQDKKVLTEFVEGFQYVAKTRELGMVILMVAIVSLLVGPYNTLFPEFASVVFHGGPKTYGYIGSCVGVGAMLGTIFLASSKPDTNLKRLLFMSTIVMGVGLICFSFIRIFPVAMIFVALAGFGGMTQYTASNILIQTGSDPRMRGRAIGIMLMAIFGMLPLGSLVIGKVAGVIGAPTTVLGAGLIAIVLALAFFRFLSQKSMLGPDFKDADTLATEEVIEENIA
jgi:MFS family permease